MSLRYEKGLGLRENLGFREGSKTRSIGRLVRDFPQLMEDIIAKQRQKYSKRWSEKQK